MYSAYSEITPASACINHYLQTHEQLNRLKGHKWQVPLGLHGDNEGTPKNHNVTQNHHKEAQKNCKDKQNADYKETKRHKIDNYKRTTAKSGLFCFKSFFTIRSYFFSFKSFDSLTDTQPF